MIGDPRERATAEALADKAGFSVFERVPSQCTVVARQMTSRFALDVRGNAVEGQAGDYLCIDAEGIAYPCAKSLFETVWRTLLHHRAEAASITKLPEGTIVHVNGLPARLVEPVLVWCATIATSELEIRVVAGDVDLTLSTGAAATLFNELRAALTEARVYTGAK